VSTVGKHPGCIIPPSVFVLQVGKTPWVQANEEHVVMVGGIQVILNNS